MIVIYCINNRNQRFQKTFNSYLKARVFILRCLHGHNVCIEGYETDNQDCASELGSLLTYGW